jgi:hypothetical protein
LRDLIATNITLPVSEAEREKRKIEDATAGMATRRHFNFLFHTLLPQNKENAMIICNYIRSMKEELNLSDNYSKGYSKRSI